MSRPLECCCNCDHPTGRSGRGEDSLYIGDAGPFCEECYDDRRCNGCQGAGEVPMMIGRDGNLDFLNGQRVGDMKCQMCDGEGYRV